MNRDFEVLAGCALRYALGRQTYIVSWVAEIIERNLKDISEFKKEIMIRDIKKAIDSEDYGREIDKVVWLKLKDVLMEEHDSK